MYEEPNTTFEDIIDSPTKSIEWNGEEYAYHTESPPGTPALNMNEVALTPWNTDWDDWSPTDTDVLIFTTTEITEKLQSPDQPMNTWE